MLEISVVIPTWRRPAILKRVIAAFNEQILDPLRFEVLVVDSFSGDDTSSVITSGALTSNFFITELQCHLNIVACKRNMGIDHANGKYILFLDDDCVPEPDHLINFLNAAKNSVGNKIVWCGGVNFEDALVSQSNYYRYRNNCHFSKNRIRLKELLFYEIVTMNMMVELKLLRQDRLRFNEDFIGYGGEDIELGWRMVKSGYKLVPCDADIKHIEINGNIINFASKIFRSSRDGFPILQSVAPEAISVLRGLSLLEEKISLSRINILDNISQSIALKIIDSSILRAFIERLLVLSDKLSIFYSPHAYRFVLAGYHRLGRMSRLNDGDSNRFNSDKV